VQVKEQPTSAETFHLIPELRCYLNQPDRLGMVVALLTEAGKHGKRLTELNLEVAVTIAETDTYAQAAAKLFRSQCTIRKHFNRVSDRTGLDLGVAAFRLWALRKSVVYLRWHLASTGMDDRVILFLCPPLLTCLCRAVPKWLKPANRR
jgi:DNA-binding CsgD family transcriptional regulator